MWISFVVLRSHALSLIFLGNKFPNITAKKEIRPNENLNSIGKMKNRTKNTR